MNNVKSRVSMDPYQSLWMAHWTQASQDSLSQIHQNRTIHDEKKEDNHDSEHGLIPLRLSKPRKAKSLDADLNIGDISECKDQLKKRLGSFDITSNVLPSAKDTRRIQIWNSTPDLKSTQLNVLSFKKSSGSSLHHENFSTSSFPYFKNKCSEGRTSQKFDLNKKMEGISSPSTEFSFCKRLGHEFDEKSKYGAADLGTVVPYVQPRALTLPPDEIHRKTEGKRGTSEPRIGLTYFDKKVVPHLKSFHEDHTVLNSNCMLSKFRGSRRTKEGDRSNLGLSHKGHFGNTHSTQREPECFNCHSYSTFFASETKLDPKLAAESSASQCLGKKDGALRLNDDPPLSDFHFPDLLREKGGKKKKLSSTRLLPCVRSIQGTSLEDLKCQQSLLHKMPKCCLHDMETLHICTTMDSVDGLPGGPRKFSKTTHHLFFTEKKDMNLSEGDEMIKESTVSAELKGKALDNMLALRPGFLCCSDQDPEFRHDIKLISSKQKEDANTTMAVLQNESSAETESLLIDFNQSTNPPRGASSLLHEIQQDFLAGKSMGKALEGAVSQNREVGIRKEATKLPVMSEELPTDLAADGYVDIRELSTSRTESLDAEHLLSHVEQHDNSHSSPRHGNPLDIEPSSRWVKRLRSSASNSHAIGTKSFKMGDASSSDKAKKKFNRIVSYSITNSEPTLGKCRGKGVPQFDNAPSLLRSMDSSEDVVKEQRDLSLLHSWIRRWCLNRETTPQARLPPQVASEPENLMFSFEELQKKQFPSIAAMALMGKAVTSFRSCEFRKKGSLVVWNTDGFRKF